MTEADDMRSYLQIIKNIEQELIEEKRIEHVTLIPMSNTESFELHLYTNRAEYVMGFFSISGIVRILLGYPNGEVWCNILLTAKK